MHQRKHSERYWWWLMLLQKGGYISPLSHSFCWGKTGEWLRRDREISFQHLHTQKTNRVVNKLLQDALNKYLTEEKLDVLGQPLPKPQDMIDWDSDAFSFEFELGLSPEFEVKLKGKKAITHYNIVADDKMINF